MKMHHIQVLYSLRCSFNEFYFAMQITLQLFPVSNFKPFYMYLRKPCEKWNRTSSSQYWNYLISEFQQIDNIWHQASKRASFIDTIIYR
jgi:hypothetical protein